MCGGQMLGLRQRKKKYLLKTSRNVEERMALPPCMGVTMNKWGPCAWNTLHAFAHTSPMVLDSARRADFKKLLYLYSSFLPCPKCRLHFVNYLDSHLTDRSLITRESCILFLHEAHNDVNARLGKRVWSLEEHMAVYSRPQRRGEAPMPWLLLIVAAVAIFALLMHQGRKIKSRQ